MGCDKPGHRHNWPSSGTLVIQRCETHCNFCEGEDAKKIWKYAWFLRRHVRSVHVKGGKGDYPNLIIPQDWSVPQIKASHVDAANILPGTSRSFAARPSFVPLI